MQYKEEHRDLFSVPEDYYLVHCISDDYALGEGIAVEFDKRFDMRHKLLSSKEFYPRFSDTQGHCLEVDRVLNLVTKQACWHKPTYRTLTNALLDMKKKCLENDNINPDTCEVGRIRKLAMPVIGCGLDKLDWDRVSAIIKEVFLDTDMEILVCKR